MNGRNTGVETEAIIPQMIKKLGILLCLLALSIGPIDAQSAQHSGAAEQPLLRQNPVMKDGVEDLTTYNAAPPLDPKAQGGQTRLLHEEELIKQAYLDAFGVEVPKPAYAPSIQSGAVAYWTSTVYMNSEMVRLYVYPDGTYRPRLSSFYGVAELPMTNMA